MILALFDFMYYLLSIIIITHVLHNRSNLWDIQYHNVALDGVVSIF